MIEKFGIGIDITTIQKFKKKPFKTNEKFYRLIFSKSEINYCLKYKNPYERFAGKFALKEALIKSINTKIRFSEIETTHLNSKPIVSIMKYKTKYNFIASLSHEKDFAVAVVISVKIK